MRTALVNKQSQARFLSLLGPKNAVPILWIAKIPDIFAFSKYGPILWIG